MDCRYVEELLSAYALNALGDGEALQVEGHLDGCPFCTALFREHAQVAASLAMVSGEVPPPESLKRATLKRVGKYSRRRPKLSFQGFTLGRAALAVTSSLSVILIGALVGIGIVNLHMSNEIEDLQEDNTLLLSELTHLKEMDGKLEDMFHEQRSVSYMMASADRETVSLQGRDAQGVLLISSHGGNGLLMARGLEPPRDERGYYVWLHKDGGQPFMVGRLTVDDTGWGALTLWPSQPIHVFHQVVVAEPAAAPSQPVLSGSIASR